MKSYNHLPLATVTKKQAAELAVSYPLAKRLVDYYNTKLYLDSPINRVKVGLKSSQIVIGLSFPALSHLKTISDDSSHSLHYLAQSLLAAVGHMRASGGVDAITEQLLQ